MFTLEVCANSVESAINAQKGGANRIELCENLFIGGTTPSFGCIIETLRLVTIPVNVLIRPRSGDFVYSEIEFQQMLKDIEICKQLGAHGIVSGILKPNGELDDHRTKELVRAAHPLEFTFHRAFDVLLNPMETLEKIIDCGCSHILTSGQKPKAYDGINHIKNLNDRAKGRIAIIAGGGVDPDNITELAKVGITQFHMSGSELIVRYNANPTGVSFTGSIIPENTIQLTNAVTIAKAASKLISFFNTTQNQ